jgi:hypothetical protein
MGVEPGTAVELGLDLERLAGLDPERRPVCRAGLEVKQVGRRAKHGNKASDRCGAAGKGASQMPDGQGYPLLPIGRLTIIAGMLGAGTLFEVPGF